MSLESVTLGQVFTTVGPALGAGWVTVLVVAWFGYRGAKAKKDAAPPIVGMGAGLASLYIDRAAIERAVGLGERFIDALERHTEAVHALKRANEEIARQLEVFQKKQRSR